MLLMSHSKWQLRSVIYAEAANDNSGKILSSNRHSNALVIGASWDVRVCELNHGSRWSHRGTAIVGQVGNNTGNAIGIDASDTVLAI